MEKQGKSKLKIFTVGAISGAIILVTVNHYSRYILTSNSLKDMFIEPNLGSSFCTTKLVENYSFDYYGSKIIVQADNIKVHSFDENNDIVVEEGKQVEVPVGNNNYLLDEYVSEKEKIVYTTLENKDFITNQYNIYLVFKWMQELYEEYLSRSNFDTLESRKEAIYNVCYNYVVVDNGYTMGGYEYSELDKNIQEDILKICQNINYMGNNGKIKKESKVSEFIDTQNKILKYKIFKIGRE